MSVSLTVTYGLDPTGLPQNVDFERWAAAVDEAVEVDGEVALKIVDESEGAQLNEKWRGGAGPTNVLSFPHDDPRDVTPRLLGDIAICAPLVFAEAERDGKSAESHWAHLLIHGLLHLLGYDHSDDEQASEMENLERDVLQRLGIDDPYRERG